MSTVDIANPIADAALVAARPEALRLTVLVPMYNEEAAAVRRDRDRDGRLRGLVSKLFYRTFNRIAEREIPPEIGDFRLMDASVIRALRTLPERNRFMKGLFAWVGFKSTIIAHDVQPRFGGTSAFGFWKLWNLALDGIAAFSTWPLRVWSYIGLAIAVLSLVHASWIIVLTLIFGADVPGFASLITLVLFLGSIQLISLGVPGEYVGRILIDVKRRPLSLIRQVLSAGEGTAKSIGGIPESGIAASSDTGADAIIEPGKNGDP